MEDEIYLSFKVGENLAALSLKYLLKISRWTEVRKMPIPQKDLLGIIPHKGELVPVVDLNIIWGQKSEKYKFYILLEEENHKKIAFGIEELLELISIPAKEIKALPKKWSKYEQFIKGIYIFKEKLIFVLNISILLKLLSTTGRQNI